MQRRREVWFLGRVQKAHIDRAGRNDSVERLRAGAVVGTSTGVVLLAASCRPPVDVVPAVTVLPPM